MAFIDKLAAVKSPMSKVQDTPEPKSSRYKSDEIELGEDYELDGHAKIITSTTYDQIQPLYTTFSNACPGNSTTQVMETSMISPISIEPVRHRSPVFNISQAIYQGISPTEQPRLHIPVKDCNCCDSIRFTNSILESCSKMQLQGSANQRARDTDIAIRAVLFGWEAVTQKYLLDPVWYVLDSTNSLLKVD